MPLSTVEVYDPASDTWTQSSDMPGFRQSHSASVVDGKMYIVGGMDFELVEPFNEGMLDEGEVDELLSIVYVYDPGTDTWTTSPSLPKSREGHTTNVVDGKIYLIGGSWGPDWIRLSEVYEYDPGLSHAISTVKPERKALTTWGQVRSVE
jgi:N-acetylneuraminic acid mutarotase